MVAKHVSGDLSTEELNYLQGKTDCGKFGTLIKMGEVPECLQLMMPPAIWWETKGVLSLLSVKLCGELAKLLSMNMCFESNKKKETIINKLISS